MSFSEYEQYKAEYFKEGSKMTKAAIERYIDKKTIQQILELIYTKYGEVIGNSTGPYLTIVRSDDEFIVNDDRQSSRVKAFVKKNYVDLLVNLTVSSGVYNYTKLRKSPTRSATAAAAAAASSSSSTLASLSSGQKKLLRQLSSPERVSVLARLKKTGVLKRGIDVRLESLTQFDLQDILAHLTPQEQKNLAEASTHPSVREEINKGIANANNPRFSNINIMAALAPKPLLSIADVKQTVLDLIASMQVGETKNMYLVYTDAANTLQKGEGIPLNELQYVEPDYSNVYKVNRSIKVQRMEKFTSYGTIRKIELHAINGRAIIMSVYVGDGTRQIKKSNMTIRGVKPGIPTNYGYTERTFIDQLQKYTNLY